MLKVMFMQALNSSRLVLTEKSGARRLYLVCKTDSGFLTSKAVLPFGRTGSAAQRDN